MRNRLMPVWHYYSCIQLVLESEGAGIPHPMPAHLSRIVEPLMHDNRNYTHTHTHILQLGLIYLVKVDSYYSSPQPVTEYKAGVNNSLLFFLEGWNLLCFLLSLNNVFKNSDRISSWVCLEPHTITQAFMLNFVPKWNILISTIQLRLEAN